MGKENDERSGFLSIGYTGMFIGMEALHHRRKQARRYLWNQRQMACFYQPVLLSVYARPAEGKREKLLLRLAYGKGNRTFLKPFDFEIGRLAGNQFFIDLFNKAI